MQDIFGKIKEEEPLRDIFFIDDNDIFEHYDICESDRKFTMDLIHSTTFIADTKQFIEDTEMAKMQIVNPTFNKKWKKKNTFRLIMIKKRLKQEMRTV